MFVSEAKYRSNRGPGKIGSCLPRNSRMKQDMKTQSAEDHKESLSQIIDSRFEELLRDSARILQFQTVSGGTPEQEAKYKEQIPACLDWLKQLAEGMGFTFRSWQGKVAEIEWAHEANESEGRRPVLGIASHIDVVTPVGSWTHGDPFSGTNADGQIWGRGIQDDKGPLIQSLYGMFAVKEAGIRPAVDTRIIIGTSEETGDWSDIELYLQERGAPDYCYTPDANFPIINGEKGMCNLRFTAKWDKVGPHADTQMQFVEFRGGQRSNIVPGLAEVVLQFPQANQTEVMKELIRETTQFTVDHPNANVTVDPHSEGRRREDPNVYETLVSFLGKPAHSSTPEKGHNAIVDGLRFFSDIETLPSTVRAFVQFLALVGSESDGSNLGIASSHDYIGDTTINLAIVKIHQEGGSAIVNVRPTMGLTCDETLVRAKAAAQAFTEAVGLEIDVEFEGPNLDAIHLDPSKPGVGQFLETLIGAFELVTGEKGELISIGGSTYAKAFPNCCAFGPVLSPKEPELAHQADERFPVDGIRRNALIYGLTISQMNR